MTFAEVSRLRPATWSDGTEGSVGATIHLFLAQGVVLLLLGAVLFGLRFLPAWLLTLGSEDTAKYFAVASQAARWPAWWRSCFVWPVFLLLLPMAALLVVEQGSFVSGLGNGCRCCGRKGRRVLMAEALALAIGLLLSAPPALLGLMLASRLDGSPPAPSRCVCCQGCCRRCCWRISSSPTCSSICRRSRLDRGRQRLPGGFSPAASLAISSAVQLPLVDAHLVEAAAENAAGPATGFSGTSSARSHGAEVGRDRPRRAVVARQLEPILPAVEVEDHPILATDRDSRT